MHWNTEYLQSSKKGAIYIMNTYGCIKNTDAKKNLFYENVLDLTSFLQDLGLFFLFFFSSDIILQDFISCDLISWDIIGSPQTILGKQVLGIQNTGLYSKWHFLEVLKKIRTFFLKFLCQGFFPETFWKMYKCKNNVLCISWPPKMQCEKNG